MSEQEQDPGPYRRKAGSGNRRSQELLDSTLPHRNSAQPKQEFTRRLGRRLRALRRRCQLSQLKLAELLGIHRSRLAKWESGAHAPPPEMLPPLAQRFGVSLDELLTGQEAPGLRLSQASRATLRTAVFILARELGIDLNRKGEPHAEPE